VHGVPPPSKKFGHGPNDTEGGDGDNGNDDPTELEDTVGHTFVLVLG